MEPLTIGTTRRRFCSLALASPFALLAGRALASEGAKSKGKSLIVLWLDGGPSQFETFDPQPGTPFGGPTKAIETAVTGIRIAEGLPKVAAEMKSLTIVRSVVSKEGDHERGRYLLKTGYRQNPSVVHPALGAICAAELPEGDTRLPRYVSILGNDAQSRAGYLGEKYDPFHIEDPAQPVPDLLSPVDQTRRDRRIEDLEVLERGLAKRNPRMLTRTDQLRQVQRARQLMDSSQVEAFKVDREPASLRKAYGDTPFGRGCLAARRLVQAGVRCVEVQLRGWDTHAKNFQYHAENNAVLDPAFAALLADLKSHGLLDSTLVVCMGEFGRTPQINGVGGRDHWNTGFSVALAGCGVRGGQVIGASDASGAPTPVDPVASTDLHASILHALGIDPATEHTATLGRPIKLSEGKPVARLFG